MADRKTLETMLIEITGQQVAQEPASRIPNRRSLAAIGAGIGSVLLFAGAYLGANLGREATDGQKQGALDYAQAVSPTPQKHETATTLPDYTAVPTSTNYSIQTPSPTATYTPTAIPPATTHIPPTRIPPTNTPMPPTPTPVPNVEPYVYYYDLSGTQIKNAYQCYPAGFIAAFYNLLSTRSGENNLIISNLSPDTVKTFIERLLDGKTGPSIADDFIHLNNTAENAELKRSYLALWPDGTINGEFQLDSPTRTNEFSIQTHDKHAAAEWSAAVMRCN